MAPRVDCPLTRIPANTAIAGVALTETPADITNFNQFTSQQNELIIIHNTAVGAGTWTLQSVADPYGRSGDITTEAIAGGAIRMFPVKHSGWIQAGSVVWLKGSAATILFSIIPLP